MTFFPGISGLHALLHLLPLKFAHLLSVSLPKPQGFDWFSKLLNVSCISEGKFDSMITQQHLSLVKKIVFGVVDDPFRTQRFTGRRTEKQENVRYSIISSVNG